MTSPTDSRIEQAAEWRRDPARTNQPDNEARARLDAALDEALDETFPASDPIAVHLPDVR